MFLFLNRYLPGNCDDGWLQAHCKQHGLTGKCINVAWWGEHGKLVGGRAGTGLQAAWQDILPISQ